jgi:hypothetical protein
MKKVFLLLFLFISIGMEAQTQNLFNNLLTISDVGNVQVTGTLGVGFASMPYYRLSVGGNILIYDYEMNIFNPGLYFKDFFGDSIPLVYYGSNEGALVVGDASGSGAPTYIYGGTHKCDLELLGDFTYMRSANFVVRDTSNRDVLFVHSNLNTVTLCSNGLDYYTKDTVLPDDASITVTQSMLGCFGTVYVYNNGAYVEYANFAVSSDYTPVLTSNSTNIVITDTDNKFCIFKSGNSLVIKNRLGGNRSVKLELKY